MSRLYRSIARRSFAGSFCRGSGGGRFVFRFNLGPRVPCALRLGEGPRAVGFSIGIFCRGVCAKRLSIKFCAWHKRRYNNLSLRCGSGAIVDLAINIPPDEPALFRRAA